MTDAPRPQNSVEQRLDLLARGVQRMADAFGSLDQRLAALADAERLQALSDRTDEHEVRARAEVAQISERIDKLEVDQRRSLDLLRAIGTAIDASTAVRSTASEVDISGPMDRLIDAVRGLRDDIAVAIGELRVETTASIERVATEQNLQLTRLHDALGAARESPTTPAPVVDDSRLAAIEHLIASLRDEFAIDRLEASVRDMALDTSSLRADVRRSFDRVLHEISSTEESLKGEVRAIDSRLTGFGDDLRIVRGLRDGLEALASGVDAVRKLAARSATSNQMGELARDLSTVLAEIETARSQVLSVGQQVGRLQAVAIDVSEGAAPAAAEVADEVEDLERKVIEDIADLGTRIEQLAERSVTAAEPDAPLAARLRSLAASARELSTGNAEDIKARRGIKKPRPGKPARKPAQQR